MTRDRQIFRRRVALAGFGVVGQGVYNRLRAAADRFEVVGIVCRNPAGRAAQGGPARLLTKDFAALPPFDILVEALGGLSPAEDFVIAALRAGADVVSANKTLVSRRYAALAAAPASGARLLYSAAVGGGVPMLETVTACRANGSIARIDAVVNGTTNFVLNRMASGISFKSAIRLAQDAGFAERDPSTDINGVDAAEKLALLARSAFDVSVDPDAIARDEFASVPASEIVAAQQAGAPVKQVASAWRTPDGVGLQVRFVRAPAASPLSRPQGEENCLVIANPDGSQTILQGKGAGREPTADSVFSDLQALLLPRKSAAVA